MQDTTLNSFRSKTYFYRPQRSCGQGNVFTGVCDSVNRWGLPQCMLGYPPPEGDPPRKERHPPGIRSMNGRYASYWNAFLSLMIISVQTFANNLMSLTKRIEHLHYNCKLSTVLKIKLKQFYRGHSTFEFKKRKERHLRSLSFSPVYIKETLEL